MKVYYSNEAMKRDLKKNPVTGAIKAVGGLFWNRVARETGIGLLDKRF